MGNNLSQKRQRMAKRNSLPSSSLSSSSSHPIPPSSSFSFHRLPSEHSGDADNEPLNDKLVSRLKDIDGEVRNSREKGLDTLGLDKVHVGFVGFSGSGKTTLIRSILGCPVSTEISGVKDKRSTFRKSRSVHFSETVSTQLVPYYFRHIDSIVLWEISYPFEILVPNGEKMEKREERLSNFFVEQHLNKFCLLFVCVNQEEPREEDLAFARAARVHGKEVIFLRTKSDTLLNGISTSGEASSLISREKIIFRSKLASTASDIGDLHIFFVCSKSIPSLIAESSDEHIKTFRQMEFIPDQNRQNNSEMDGRRHTMERSTVDNSNIDSCPVLRLEEEQLMRFIVYHIDDFPLSL